LCQLSLVESQVERSAFDHDSPVRFQPREAIAIGQDMPRLIAGLISLSLMCGFSAFAQDTRSAARLNFPTGGFLQFPPHFQPRPASAEGKVKVAPPLLPSYAQPPVPEEGYVWMPGFWAWREEIPDYFWVPGTWVRPPRAGLLWTPAYWSRVDGGYVFHSGYWAEQVGFYGGIDYGYGYTGDGYQGGRWEDGIFFYDRAANNLGSLNIAHAYDQAIAGGNKSIRVSFSGGSKGTAARPTPQQEQFANERHIGPTAEQLNHFEMAAKDRSLYSKLNGDEPGVAATSRPGIFNEAVTRSSGRSNDDVTTGTNMK
jgi:WXXGXW repeat (2 copies)